MTTRICIQDPDYQASVSLHEALNAAGEGATSAAGAYAFVSKGGVDLLMGAPSFSQMLGKKPIQLIVGMDAITNEAAIGALQILQSRHHGLEITAFVHDKKGTVFHPKVCWFKNDQGGVVVTGSGNLTVGGLRKNREVFSVAQVDAEEINSIEQNWEAWIESNRNNLHSLDSEVVSERAKLNNIRKAVFLDDLENVDVVGEKQLQEVQVFDIADMEAAEDLDDWSFSSNAFFLVAEIPKSGRRWKQANFTLETFVGFFGGIRGDNSKRLVLRAIYDSGEYGNLEDRPCVTVASDNFRVELEAASGLDYPVEGRPIGVFVRISVRMFAYYLSMPGAPSYESLRNWLDENAGRESVRRVVSSVNNSPEIIDATPLARFLKN
ncbi:MULTISPECIES: phospholipase D family protein [unclassified Pseudomonas]|uniref:phospholipase D family protein n=1 Tax=unclassified Pseudomonas TaxID=196821 RepID=UPI000922CC5A|nr:MULTISPECIES: phospholipase D family protein [unclassified Pseudomonas]SFY11475.1 PLD-like domain-containing protein [Pseudomonas sp. NFACC47-1]SFY37721.1 PLD-like domain-containing protein [Pseudomonas sp. NFACC43]